MESFDSTKTSLREILRKVDEGKIQLPDFQRGWIWDDNRIKALLASIAKSFPIGAIMLLETGNPSVKFRPKPIEGVLNCRETKPEHLVLDGQQRITSLYQTIKTNEIVKTKNDKNREIYRWYYIDMQKAIDPSIDLEEAILSVNEKKQITKNIGREIELDLSSLELEYENLMYPVCMIDEYSTWRKEYNKYWKHESSKIEFWDEFEDKIIKSYENYMIPVIVMKKENSKEAVCQVFEKVNTGGVVLTVFELLTATYAADDFNLKESWQSVHAEFKEYKVLGNTQNTDLLQSITLLARYRKRLSVNIIDSADEIQVAVSCKRKDILNLTLGEYKGCVKDIQNGYIKAAMILAENHIYSSRDLPYNTQLIPMAAILAVMGNQIDIAGNKNKLMRWFWCGVFGELYGSATETRSALDLPQVVEWITSNGPEPKTIYDSNFSQARLHTLRTRNSAAYKGVYALLLGENLRDWLSNSPINIHNYFSRNIDIHHIFPVAWCVKNSIHADHYNCIINKTPLSSGTNRFVSGDAPSKYLDRLLKRIGVPEEDFNSILSSHLLEPEDLRDDDFFKFVKNRKEFLLRIIEQATGKPISRDDVTEEEGEYIADDNGDVFEAE
ncbi:MAG: DUF262 domain-containing protein [Candidatus Cloacimonetes bacterium]|jgi:hypothetical protein|nr:DUF262 domain-containing protein [Candidatus Cloacimonadota bacterium]